MDQEDERVQRAVDEKWPLAPTPDSVAYERLFRELKRQPPLQPGATFSGRVVEAVRRQRAQDNDRLLYWGISLSLALGAFLSSALSIDQPTALAIVQAFVMAKGWLLVGFVCMAIFLWLEHQLLIRKRLADGGAHWALKRRIDK